MTPLAIQFGEADLLAAISAHYRATGRTRFPFTLALLVLALAVGALVELSGNDPRLADGVIVSAASFVAIAMVLFAIRQFNLSVRIPRHVRSEFAMQKDLHSPATIAWDDNAICIETATASINRPFSHCAFWLEESGMVMLYSTKLVYFSIPARAFASDSQRGALVTLLKQHKVPLR